MKKKVLKLLMIMCMLLSLTSIKVQATSALELGKSLIKVGQNTGTILNSDATDLPIPANVDVAVNLFGQAEQAYEVHIENIRDEVVTKVQPQTGSLTSEKKTIHLQIPSDMEGGIYNVVAVVGGNSFKETLTVLNNTVFKNKNISTDIQTKGGHDDKYLVDGTLGDFTGDASKGVPSRNSPHTIKFNFDQKTYIDSLVIFAGNGNDHSLKTIQFSYQDEYNQKQNIDIKDFSSNEASVFHNENQELEIDWKTSSRVPVQFKLKSPVEVNNIEMTILDSHTNWGNVDVISEFQAWGYALNDGMDLKCLDSYGITGENNIVRINGYYHFSNSQAKIEFINNKTTYFTQNVNFNNGKLDTELTIPNSFTDGQYIIRVTVDDQKKEFKYDLLSQKGHDITQNFHTNQLNLVSGKSEYLLDNAIQTNAVIRSESGNVLIRLAVLEKTTVLAERIKIYTDQGKNISNIELKLGSNPNKKKPDNEIITSLNMGESGYSFEWKKDDMGTYCEIVFNSPFLTYEYYLNLKTSQNLAISDIQIIGTYFSKNDLGDTKITCNNSAYTNMNMFDNDIETTYDPSHSSVQTETYEFDMKGKLAKISQFVIVSNHATGQGIKKVKLEYVNEKDETKEIGVFESNLKTQNDLREAFQMTFEEVEAKRLKVTLLDWNNGWGHYSIAEMIACFPTIQGTYFEISDKQGIAGEENVVNLEGTYKDISESIKVTLNDESQTPVISQELQLVKGILSSSLIIPNNIKEGKYSIQLKSDHIDTSFSYELVKNIYPYMNYVEEKFTISTNATTVGNLNSLVDNDTSTTLTIKPTQGQALIQLKTLEKNNQLTNMVINKVRIFADNQNLSQVELKVAGNPKGTISSSDDIVVSTLKQKPVWKTDSKGRTYFDLTCDSLSLTYEYYLIFYSQSDFVIRDMEVNGIYFEKNDFSAEQVFFNGTELSDTTLFDNNIETTFNGDKQSEIIINMGNQVSTINQLFIAGNHALGQGVTHVRLSYMNDLQEWKDIGEYKFDLKTKDDRREVSCVYFTPVEAAQLKIEILDWNKEYGHYSIAEMGASYSKKYTVNAVARSLDKIMIKEGYVQLSGMSEDVLKAFNFHILSTSDKQVVDMNGKVTPQSEEKNIKVRYTVQEKGTSNQAVSKDLSIYVARRMEKNEKEIRPTIDTTSFLKNPSMGWVQYIEGFECRMHDQNEVGFHSNLCTVDATNIENYWQQMDEIYKQNFPISTIYIRMPWSWYEPQEGKYAWEDKTSELSRLIKGAQDRNLELAFRILINSASMEEQATPEWLFQEGAPFVNHETGSSYGGVLKEPLIDSSIFIEKYGNFVNAFGKKFNNEKMNVSYIDGMGYGTWGETENGVYVSSTGSVETATHKIIEMYSKAFSDVLLGAQYAGIGSQYALDNHDYVIRRDAFGSGYLSADQKEGILRYFNDKGVPVYAENCYHHFDTLQNNWGGATRIENRNNTLKNVIKDAIDLHANTLDARVLEDCKLWLKNDQDNSENLVEQFALNGGYRLSLTNVIIPQTVVNNQIRITHTWQNNGVGILPNKNERWNNKYKVSFALLDSKTNKVIYQFNESTDKVNPGDWIKGQDYHYDTTFSLPSDIQKGDYQLAVSIVNDKLDNNPDLQLAMSGLNIENKWYILDKINIKGEEKEISKINIEASDYGTIQASSLEVEKGQDVILTILPHEGYRLDKLFINNQEVKVNLDTYTLKNVKEDIHVKALFTKVDEDVIPNPIVTVISQDKKVSVSGKLPKDTQLSSMVLNQQQLIDLKLLISKVNPDFLKNATLEKVYNLKLVVNGLNYNDAENIEVTLKLEDKLKGKKLGIIYIDADGKIEMIESTTNSEYIRFIAKYFSQYAIVSYKEDNPMISKPEHIKNPDTADDTKSGHYFILGIISMTVIYLSLQKKKKRNVLIK